MPRRQPALRRFATATRWPVGIALTSWRYMWRISAVHRYELSGSPEQDRPPPLPGGVDRDEIQAVDQGAGPFVHRLYRARIRGSRMAPEELMATLTADLDQMAPSEFASFQRVTGETGRLVVGDEYVVRMPGPWDGPVRVIRVTPTSFRLATLEGHLEAGQIEFRATPVDGTIEFVIESWARSGDRLSDLLYSRVRMAKEIQLHMWTSVLERVTALAGGSRDGGIVVNTRRLDPGGAAGTSGTGGTGPGTGRAQRRLDELAGRRLNFDPGEPARDPRGWHFDDMVEELPHEASGPPVEGGSFEVARRLMVDYQVADPGRVRATYSPDTSLQGRDMLLRIGFAGVPFYVGVRVGDVYDENRVVDGREARVFGWDYSTLEGHFEEGKMHYEVWKWLDTGTVEFRLHAASRRARSGPLWLRFGFLLVGRTRQLAFYRAACRRMRRLTESQLETERIALALR